MATSDILWDRITEVKKVEGKRWVYDLSIPNCHNFIANGIFVHNINVLDAIAFVLGRTSAKSLRADKLHELIFSGTGSAAQYASVVLYLDNSAKIFPFEESEISITRKVNRRGVSIYKLNGKTTTREKIVDALAAARIYSDGHNIVLQGDITDVIEMMPEERRTIVDEISGIADYNDKKEKATKDLEAVDAKLKEFGIDPTKPARPAAHTQSEGRSVPTVSTTQARTKVRLPDAATKAKLEAEAKRKGMDIEDLLRTRGYIQ
jgi:hypothetical protein